ncbi:hypothetical protein G7046_g9433 [Stylonectria norvegica]|nr:hypothetical protein G7046_g9433 [Stylonectria norvegica]
MYSLAPYPSKSVGGIWGHSEPQNPFASGGGRRARLQDAGYEFRLPRRMSHVVMIAAVSANGKMYRERAAVSSCALGEDSSQFPSHPEMEDAGLAGGRALGDPVVTQPYDGASRRSAGQSPGRGCMMEVSQRCSGRRSVLLSWERTGRGDPSGEAPYGPCMAMPSVSSTFLLHKDLQDHQDHQDATSLVSMRCEVEVLISQSKPAVLSFVCNRIPRPAAPPLRFLLLAARPRMDGCPVTSSEAADQESCF